MDAEQDGRLKSGTISVVVASNPEAYAVIRAEKQGKDVAVISKKDCGSQQEFEQKILETLERYQIELIILAGFMNILSSSFIARYRDRIINVHPSLIPSFCGKGFYGLNVHKAALEYGVKVTGATVHYVNEVPDGGRIILQKAVAIRKEDTPETLQKRVMLHAEWKILPRAAEIVSKEIKKQKEV